jgi:folate-binding protein YgfZ
MNSPHFPPEAVRLPSGDCHFGNPAAESALALTGTAAMPLAHLGWLRAAGMDAESFLQGQLSSDVRKLTPERGQLSSYSSPKGRMLAVLHLLRDADSVYMELHGSVLDSVLKRLRMYVLRAKVQLAQADRFGIGLTGPEAPVILAQLGLPAPTAPLECAWLEGVCVTRKQGDIPRYSLLAPQAAAAELWTRLMQLVPPAGTQAWKLLDILADLPTIYPATQDRFVPQMCNLDTLGGISFDKGCYTGQEIVARVHYRGAVKRRMSMVRLPQEPPAPGSKIEGREIVDAAPHPEGGSLALVVSAETAA